MRAMRFAATAAFVAAAVLAGCTMDTAEPLGPAAEPGETNRGAIGKADLTGSCAGEGADRCGGISDGNCWCDELCSYFGDCCEDKRVVCDGCPDPADPAVHYVSPDPAECAVLFFRCEPGQSAFTDPCGCGCIDDEEPAGACGGIAGLTCQEPEFCDYDGDSCGYADQMGTCQPRPEACIELYDPVCGCDGQTYSNGCHAHAAGVDVQHEGPCDCRSTGCDEGHYCSYCFTQFQCIPEGAVC